MKKATLLLVLLSISALGFSQNKIGGNDPILGIDIIIKKDPGSQPIINTENDPLVDEINKLEQEYLNLKADEIHKEFSKHNLSKLKTKKEVFKTYIMYLKEQINESDKNNNKSNGHCITKGCIYCAGAIKGIDDIGVPIKEVNKKPVIKKENVLKRN